MQFRNAPTILVYHELSDASNPLTDGLQVTTKPDVFRDHVRFLAKNFDLISPSDLGAGRPPKRPLLITFDDAYRSVLDVGAPILKDVNAPSILFTNPEPIAHATVPFDNLIALAFARFGGREIARRLGLRRRTCTSAATFIASHVSPLPYDEALQLERQITAWLGSTQATIRRESALFLEPQDLPKLQTYRMELGNHSMSHRYFRSLSGDQLDLEICQGRDLLEHLSGQNVRYLAIPYGHEEDATDLALATARASGHRATFLVHARCNDRRPAEDVFYRVGPGNVKAELLPIVLQLLPRLRTWKQRGRGLAHSQASAQDIVVSRADRSTAPLLKRKSMRPDDILPPPAASAWEAASLLATGTEPLRVDCRLPGISATGSHSPGADGHDDSAPGSKVLVFIVGFNNARDISACLEALRHSWSRPEFDVFIAENAGTLGFANLVSALDANPDLCAETSHPTGQVVVGAQSKSYHLKREYGAKDGLLHIIQMSENLGYAGAINACLRPMLDATDWHAIWVLNPDTQPMPSALFELADHAARFEKGMVGSRISAFDTPDQVSNCGLKWQKLPARTASVGYDGRRKRQHPSPLADKVLDAPSGASIYVTRALIERIGLMDDRYFLYFEDLEWGYRAKRLNQLGISLQSVVRHKGGTTLGSASRRADRSRLSVYLEFRNRILFVRAQHSGWVIWTTLLQMVHIAAFLASGSIDNTASACRGLMAGLRGECGRPDYLLAEHKVR